MVKCLLFLYVLMLCFPITNFIHADLVEKVLQNGKDEYEGCSDTYIEIEGKSEPYLYENDNYNDTAVLTLANWVPWNHRFARVAIKFDLSILPEKIGIKKALLELYFLNGNLGLGTCSLFTIESQWEPKEVTWKLKKKDEPWDKKGGDYAYDDNELSKFSEKSNNWEAYDVTRFIKKYYKDPSKNYGIFLYPSSDDKAGSVPNRNYYSSEAEDLEKRPKLTIEYETDTKIISGIKGGIPHVSFKVVDGYIILQLPDKKDITLNIFDLSGKKMFSFAGNGTGVHTVVSQLPSNKAYLVSLQIDNKAYVQKYIFIK